MDTYGVFYKNSIELEDYNGENLKDNYTLVRILNANSIDDVYYQMQGEIWSPNGERRELIEALGLKHTSMSVGDVIFHVESGRYFVVDNVGFVVDPINE
jgi:hypothetical protein